MMRGPQWLGTGLRAVGLVAVVGAVAGPPADDLMAHALPLQRAVYAGLMPDFHVHHFALARSGPHRVIDATAVSRHYLVMQGRAFREGLGLDAQTPARTGLTYPALLLAGALLLVRGQGRRLPLAWALCACLALALLCVPLPLVLAGQQWGLGVTAFSEMSVPALLVGLSELLLHGAGYGLAALALLAVRAVARS